jgi:hypothetical protein
MAAGLFHEMSSGTNLYSATETAANTELGIDYGRVYWENWEQQARTINGDPVYRASGGVSNPGGRGKARPSSLKVPEAPYVMGTWGAGKDDDKMWKQPDGRRPGDTRLTLLLLHEAQALRENTWVFVENPEVPGYIDAGRVMELDQEVAEPRPGSFAYQIGWADDSISVYETAIQGGMGMQVAPKEWRPSERAAWNSVKGISQKQKKQKKQGWGSRVPNGTGWSRTNAKKKPKSKAKETNEAKARRLKEEQGARNRTHELEGFRARQAAAKKRSAAKEQEEKEEEEARKMVIAQQKQDRALRASRSGATHEDKEKQSEVQEVEKDKPPPEMEEENDEDENKKMMTENVYIILGQLRHRNLLGNMENFNEKIAEGDVREELDMLSWTGSGVRREEADRWWYTVVADFRRQLGILQIDISLSTTNEMLSHYPRLDNVVNVNKVLEDLGKKIKKNQRAAKAKTRAANVKKDKANAAAAKKTANVAAKAAAEAAEAASILASRLTPSATQDMELAPPSWNLADKMDAFEDGAPVRRRSSRNTNENKKQRK